MIRARVPADVPLLADIVMAQRGSSGYPVSLPPGGAEALLARSNELGAWVWADEADAPVGHVSVTRVAEAEADADEVRAWCAALDVPPSALGVLSALVVAESTRGQGIGRALLEHATLACRDAGLAPCLDVVAAHAAALRLYERLGWETVAEVTPVWLPPGKGPVVAMVLR